MFSVVFKPKQQISIQVICVWMVGSTVYVAYLTISNNFMMPSFP